MLMIAIGQVEPRLGECSLNLLFLAISVVLHFS
jgi:hypothetical protein